MGVLYQNGDLIYGGARMKRISQYEYDRLTPAEKNNGIIYNIYDADGVQGYNPKGVALTQAEYDALVEAGETESNVMYFITDGTTTTLQSVWDKVGTTPLDSSLPSDCSQAINQLKSNLTNLLEWKYLTEISPTSSGTIDIDIPANAKELYIYSTSVAAPLIINCALLTTSTQWFHSGYYIMNNNYAGFAVSATSTKINSHTQTKQGAYASGTIKFYYR